MTDYPPEWGCECFVASTVDAAELMAEGVPVVPVQHPLWARPEGWRAPAWAFNCHFGWLDGVRVVYYEDRRPGRVRALLARYDHRALAAAYELGGMEALYALERGG